MVHTDKITGQMVMAEDGTIISSSGDLSSNEAIAQHIVSLISHPFPIAIKVPVAAPPGSKGTGSNAAAAANGSTSSDGGGSTSPRLKRMLRSYPWKSVSVDYGSHCYVACLSNRKIHVVKRVKSQEHPH